MEKTKKKVVSHAHWKRRTLAWTLAAALALPAGIGSSAIVHADSTVVERPGIVAEADRGKYETLLDLARLNKVGHIMYVGAHPDDERAAALAYLHDSPLYNVEVSYAVSNWGEGGENALGPELYDGLGVIRSQELKTAATFDQKTQYYLGMYDSGYTPNLEVQIVNPVDGTKGVWDPNVYVYNVAKLLRLTRPDVVINGHSDSDRQHAQHQTAHYFTQLGIIAAKDSSYEVKDDDGTLLDTWEVKRVVTGTSNGSEAVSLYTNRQDPYVPTGFKSYDAKGLSLPITWVNHTYSMIGSQGYNNHMSQSGSRNGQQGEGAVNGTATNYYAVEKMSAPGYVNTGWTDDAVNKGTFFAGIDTSLSRVNQSLSSAHQMATSGDVAQLKTSLDAVVKKFPNGPAAADMTADGMPAGYDKEPGDSTVETVKAQIQAVSQELASAAEALEALEKYVADNPNLAGRQEFVRNLSLVREHVDAFAKDLYGITQTVEVSDKDVYPGQTITVTTTLSCLADAFGSEVKLPAQMMTGNQATTITVPEGSVVVPLNDAPVAYSGKGQVYGGEMDVKGYTYKYEVTLSENYKEYTGPFNVPYDEAYNNPNETYPLGSSDYVESDFVFDKKDPSTVQPQNRDVRLDITTKLDHPYAIPPILGKAAVEVEGISYGSYVEPEVRLVPQISITVNQDSKAVMRRTSDQAQESPLATTITNNTETAKEVRLDVDIAGGSEITVGPKTVTVPAKGTVEVVLTVHVPASFEGSPVITIVADVDGVTYCEGYEVIDYTQDNYNKYKAMQMISKQHLYRAAEQRLSVADFILPDDEIRIGFAGSSVDDIVLTHIRSMYGDTEKAKKNCVLLSAVDIAKSGAELKSQFDTIVVGKTAYGIVVAPTLDLNENGKNLLEFANLGGNLVVHYQNEGKVPASIAPKPFSLVVNGPGNLCLPACDVYLDPSVVGDHPFYNYPNKVDLQMEEYVAGDKNVPESFAISRADVWDGWKQQRAEWCPKDLATVTDLGYQVLLAGRDTTGQPLRPGIEYMAMENGGHYYYSSIVWDRQLMDLVPGAFKLYANMISTGYQGREPQTGIVVSPEKQEITSDTDDIVLHIANKNTEQVKNWLAALKVSGKAKIQKQEVAISVDEEKGTVTISKSDLPKVEYEDDYFQVSLVADGVQPVKVKAIFTVSAAEKSLDFLSLSTAKTLISGEEDLVFTLALSPAEEEQKSIEPLSDQLEEEKDAAGTPAEDTDREAVEDDADQDLAKEESAEDPVREEETESEVQSSTEKPAAEEQTENVSSPRSENLPLLDQDGRRANLAAAEQVGDEAENAKTPEAWLAAMKASGDVIINGKTVPKDKVKIDESEGSITIAKEAESLLISGGEKKLTVGFQAAGYSLVKLVNVVTVKTDKDFVSPSGVKAAKSALDSGKDDLVLNVGTDAEAKRWLIALEKNNGVMKINDTVVDFVIDIDEATITVDKGSAVLSVAAGSSKDLNISITVTGYGDLTLNRAATVSKAGDGTGGTTGSSGGSRNKNKDDQVTTEVPKEPVVAAPEPSGPSSFGFKFTDVTTEGSGKHWAADAISRLVSKQIINGVAKDGNYYFYPNNQITRAEFTAIVVRALGLVQNEKSTFADVSANQWYSEAVAAGVKAGLIQGTGSNQFSPNAPITRQEAMSIMVNALNYNGNDVAIAEIEIDQLLSGFADAKDVSAWAKQAAAVAVKEGIVKGDTNGKVNPTAPLTRAETAQMIANLLEKF